MLFSSTEIRWRAEQISGFVSPSLLAPKRTSSSGDAYHIPMYNSAGEQFRAHLFRSKSFRHCLPIGEEDALDLIGRMANSDYPFRRWTVFESDYFAPSRYYFMFKHDQDCMVASLLSPEIAEF